MHFNYKRKYDRLKRCIKLYILENSCLTDEICHLQSELAATRSQRIYLIKRLMFYEGLEKANIVRNCVINGKPESNENFIRALSKNKQSILYPSEIEEDSQNGSTSKIKKSFPLHLNNLLLHSLGDISGSSNFHNESWIYPVGYVATRIYAHPKDPSKKCVFTCKILNNAGVPQFQIIPDNDLDGVFFGETPNMCHAELLNTIQRYSNKSVKIPFNAQGESFFGLSNPKIQSLLRLDPGFQRCFNFKGYNVQNQKSLNNPGLSFETLQTFLT